MKNARITRKEIEENYSIRAVEFANAQVDLDTKKDLYDYARNINPDATPRQLKEARRDLWWAESWRNEAKRRFIEARAAAMCEREAANGKGEA